MKKLTRFIALLILALVLIPACRKEAPKDGKIEVVATLFPLYDFARQVGGDQARVTLLMPPGIEPHSYEPRPDDLVRINRADLFIYTNRYMEPWAGSIISGVDRKVKVIEASKGIALMPAPGEAEAEHGHAGHAGAPGEGERMDPHAWLDLGFAQVMVATILSGYLERDPAHADYYRKNAAALTAQLAALDQRYRDTLAKAPRKVFLHGGHYAFGYLARRYGLSYLSAAAVNAEAEPTPARLAELVQLMRKEQLRYVFTEELLSPRVAETLARETGAGVLRLNAGHNVSRDDLERGVTFVQIMEENLKNLQKGLQ